MKKIVFLLMVMLSSVNFMDQVSKKEEMYKDRMKDFIKEIRANTDKNKIIITQNGNELYYKKGILDKEFFNVTDGTTQESLYYGDYLKFNTPTNKSFKEELLSRIIPIRKNGKPVFIINYAKGENKQVFLNNEDIKTGFVSEMLPSFEANKGYETINKYNTNDIKTLNDVKNFLCILNPEKYKNIDQYFDYLKNTDFDLLIIEASIDNIFLTKDQIAKLKMKKAGGKRIVIAYFSVGEAEDYRFYWKSSWNMQKPSWIVVENPSWKGNYVVKYWDLEWKNIIKDYQKKLDEIGVDGYLLDTVDTHEYFEEK